MKKIFLIFITIITFNILPANIKGADYCSNYDNSPDKCKANSSCNWIIYNEGAGDGYCKLKPEFTPCAEITSKDSCLKNTYCEWGSVSGCQDHIQNRSIACTYEVDTFNQNVEGNSVKCQFTVTVDANNKLGISWKNLYNNKSGTLNDNQISFDCSGKSINFWNSQLPKVESKLEQTTMINGIEIPRYDFNEKFKELSNGNRVCPRITTSNINANYYVVFTDTIKEEDFIYNTGGVQDDIPHTGTPGVPNLPDNNDDNNSNKGQEIKDKYIGNLTCEGAPNFYFPKLLPDFTRTLYNIIKLFIPILLIIKGMIDMLKATSSSKEDEMKKAQRKFIQRLIAGVCGFTLFILVETVISWIDDKTGNEGAMNCVNCFINGSENCTVRNKNQETNNADTAFYVPLPQGTKYSVTSEYGNRTNPKTGKSELHKGIDLSAPEGTNIVSSASGKVIKAEFHKDFGNHICIEHTYNNKKYYTTYMHLSEIKVQKNEEVGANQVIGIIGATGQVTGIHLHFEMSTSPTVHSNKCFDPTTFIAF